jgi:hypothetical protein
MAIKKAKRSIRRAQPRRRTQPTKKPSPGEFALRERTLPGRRFVEFPLVQGKIAEKVQLFTTTNYHSLTIEFQDRTSLHLDIDPGFTINTKFMRLEKGDLEILAEWPPIHISSEQP